MSVNNNLSGVLAGLALAACATVSQAAPVTVSSITSSGIVETNPAQIHDGNFGLGTWWSDPSNVPWFFQEGAAGAVLTQTFDKTYTLTDVALGVDINDLYAVQVSTNGTAWNTLFVSLPAGLDAGYTFGGESMIKRTSVAGEAAYSSLIDFAPVQARYARIYAVSGDGLYSVSELSFSGVAAAVPEPETYAMLLAGLGMLGFMGKRRTTQ